MLTAKLFENGRSQAVRLPKEYRFSGDKVSVNKVGEAVILLPKNHEWAGFVSSLELFSDDYMAEKRVQYEVQERDSL